jgi:RNA polymerase sigma-32 factor
MAKPTPKPVRKPTGKPKAEETHEAAPVLAPAVLAPREKAGPLAPRDPLQRYMTEVGRHSLLTRKEEDELAQRYFHDPEGNVDAAYRLVTANLRLVVKIAYQYRRAAFNILDLIQEGNIGLMQAVKKFDPTRGIKLSSYAAYWIRAYILRFIMDNFRLVKLGTTEAQRKLFFNLKKEQEKLAREGISPEPRLLAERLQVSEKDVVEMQGRIGNEELSLDNPVGDDRRQTQLDRLEAHTRDAEEQLADHEVQDQFHRKLKDFAKDLKGKEKTIFEKRLLAEQPLTLQEIGDKYGLTRERVRQLEAQLTSRLRAYMAKELPDFRELSLAKSDKG